MQHEQTLMQNLFFILSVYFITLSSLVSFFLSSSCSLATVLPTHVLSTHSKFSDAVKSKVKKYIKI